MKKLLLKSLLVAVGLLTGGSAWGAVGDKTTNLDIDFSNAISDGKVAGTVGSITIGGSNTAIADGILSVGNGTSTATLTGSAAGSGDQVVVTFDLAFGKLMNKSVWFRLKDSSGNVIGQFDFDPYDGIINTNTFDISLDDIYYGSNTVIWDRKVAFTITLNYKTRKITTATTCYKSGTNRAATNAEHTVDMTNSNPMASFEIGSSYNNDGRRCSFDNLKVETIEGEATTATSYTVNYKLGDDVVKTVSSSDGVVGQVVTALTAIDGTEEGFVGNHYLITAAEAPSMTLVANAASNVLNVSVRAPYTATLTVTKYIGGVAQTPEVKNLTETDEKDCSWAYTYNRYEYSDSKYYIADEISSYGWSGTFSNGDAIEKTANYTYADASVMGYTEMGTGGTNTALSGGATDSNNSNLAACTLDAGGYVAEIYVVSRAGSGSHTRNEGVYVDGVSVISTPTDTYGLISLPFTVTNDDTPVYVKGVAETSSYNTDNLDYVAIRKVESVAATIGDRGWTTFASPYALDLSNMEATTGDVTAYYASAVGDDKVTMTSTESTGVAAGAGIMLKGTAGATITIPVVASGTAISGNKLVGCPNGATLTSETPNVSNFYVLVNGATAAEFQNLATSVASKNVTIPAGKAYLDATGVADVRSLKIAFEDAETGINEVNAPEAAANGYYNLAGQRVANPTKGLYIVNGKKVLVK